jgi:hypothetical protein
MWGNRQERSRQNAACSRKYLASRHGGYPEVAQVGKDVIEGEVPLGFEDSLLGLDHRVGPLWPLSIQWNLFPCLFSLFARLSHDSNIVRQFVTDDAGRDEVEFGLVHVSPCDAARTAASRCASQGEAHAPPRGTDNHTRKGTQMLRKIGKAFGVAMAMMCLVSTLAIAQEQAMTCTKDDGKGNCTAAAGADGHVIPVAGNNLKTGALMTCIDRGYVVNCRVRVASTPRS